MKELCGELPLETLAESGPLATGLANVRYWLSYEQTSVQPLLQLAPTPLMELGTAAALQFSEDVGGSLNLEAIRSAEAAWLPEIEDGTLRDGVAQVLRLWSAALMAQQERPRWQHEGFRSVGTQFGIQLKDLEALGHADIQTSLPGEGSRRSAPLNQPVSIWAYDSKDRPLKIDVEHPMGAEVLVREHPDGGGRDLVFWMPGPYRVRVPKRATGDILIVAGAD